MGTARRTILNSARDKAIWSYKTARYPLTAEDLPTGRNRLEIWNPHGTEIVRNIAHRFMAEVYFLQLQRLEKLLEGDVNPTTWRETFPSTPYTEQLVDLVGEWGINNHNQETVHTLVDCVSESGYRPQRAYAIFRPDPNFKSNNILLPCMHKLISNGENSELATLLRKSSMTPTHEKQELHQVLFQEHPRFYEDKRAIYQQMVEEISKAVCTTMVVFSTQPQDYTELYRFVPRHAPILP